MSHLVLMIEDDPDILELLAARVRKVGLEVITAVTGESGVALARERKPELIVLDIRLPDIDGWEVIDRLATFPETADIPVLVASIVDPPGPHEAPTVRAHLVKPIAKGRLEMAVLELTGGSP